MDKEMMKALQADGEKLANLIAVWIIVIVLIGVGIGWLIFG